MLKITLKKNIKLLKNIFLRIDQCIKYEEHFVKKRSLNGTRVDLIDKQV